MKVLYTNGDILTMDGREAGAVLTEDGRITAAGRADEMDRAGAEIVDLEGCTLMPAFIDGHSHFSAVANGFVQIDLEACRSFREIGEAIRRFIRDRKPAKGSWLTARGYDPWRLEEKSHPDREMLDRAAPGYPVILQHQSGHVGVFNTMALELLGVREDTQAPEGGMIEKKDGRLTGYMEENAFIQYQKKIPAAGWEELREAYVLAQRRYLSHGIVSVQEGLMTKEMEGLYQGLLASGILQVDLTAYASPEDYGILAAAFPGAVSGRDRHFRLGGMKIFLDGSPQGRTAWMREPYEGEKDYNGYGTMEDSQVEAAAEQACRAGVQLLAHCNGDAAAAQLIRALAHVRKEGMQISRCRPVLIHGQLLGADQLEAVKELGIMPSFFPAHVYYWGDVHLKNFGLERAAHISPAGSALKAGIPFTFHQDTPVVDCDMLETVWCAAVRRTKEGTILGPDERIPVEEGLKAVTANSALQYGEAEMRGTVTPGKYADFTILDRNPLKIPPDELPAVRVMQTIRRGETLWKREEICPV